MSVQGDIATCQGSGPASSRVWPQGCCISGLTCSRPLHKTLEQPRAALPALALESVNMGRLRSCQDERCH